MGLQKRRVKMRESRRTNLQDLLRLCRLKRRRRWHRELIQELAFRKLLATRMMAVTRRERRRSRRRGLWLSWGCKGKKVSMMRKKRQGRMRRRRRKAVRIWRWMMGKRKRKKIKLKREVRRRRDRMKKKVMMRRKRRRMKRRERKMARRREGNILRTRKRNPQDHQEQSCLEHWQCTWAKGGPLRPRRMR